MKSIIQKLVETPGPSGFEYEIRDVIKELIGDAADDVRVDALGSLIARKGNKTDQGMRVMVSAHIDEIGLMITHVDKNGFVRFTNIGGINPLTCYGGRVLFMDGTRGVIGMDGLAPGKMPKLTDLYIDVGATSQEDCPVNVGDVCGFDRPFLDLGKRMVGKSMDNRISAAVAIEALKRLESTPHEIHFVFSTQEEVGLRGATTAAYGIDPDVGFAVDVTRSGDTPRLSTKMATALGDGPAIKVRDSSFIADPRLVDWMVKTASEAKIPYQLEVLEAGGTDGRAIQLTRKGVPAGCVSIACRYIHSPSEMVDSEDVENAVKLLVALLSHPISL
jgi:tetrahedral aminopeptidase